MANILRFIIGFSCISYLSIAKPVLKTQLSVDTSKVEGLSRYEIDFMRKSAYGAIISSSDLEILLDQGILKKSSDISFYSLELESKPVAGKKFDLSFSVVLKPAYKTINIVHKKKVPRERVQIEARRLIYKVIYEEGYNSQSDSLVTNVSGKKLQNSIKENAKENKVKRKIKLKDKEEGSNVDSLEDETQSVDSATPRKKDRNTPEFKKRKSKSNSSKTSKFKSPNINLEKDSLKSKKKRNKLTLINRFNISTGVETEVAKSRSVLDTKDEILTTTNIQRLVVNATINIKVEQWAQHFQFGTKISKITSSNNYGLSPKIALFGDYKVDAYDEKLFGKFGLEYDRSSYVSIADFGSGLESFSNSVLWAGVGLDYHQNYSNKIFFAQAAIKKVFIGVSDQSLTDEDLVIDGNKFIFEIGTSLYKKWGIGISYENSSYTAISNSDFKTQHQTVSMLLTYR